MRKVIIVPAEEEAVVVPVKPRECKNCKVTMDVGGAMYLPGQLMPESRERGGVQMEPSRGFNIIPYICRNCGYVELYDERVLARGV